MKEVNNCNFDRPCESVLAKGVIYKMNSTGECSIMWQQFAANCLEQDDMVSKIVERNYKAAEIKVALTCSRSASWPCALL
ncbi:hypothetical protein EJB05_20866, partial [Eragrostis curvula]